MRHVLILFSLVVALFGAATPTAAIDDPATVNEAEVETVPIAVTDACDDYAGDCINPVCPYDSDLGSDDPGCVAPVEVCEFDPALPPDDAGCVAPGGSDVDACAYDPSIAADDPGCGDACPTDSTLPADDPGCVEVEAAEVDACAYDPALTADDPGCAAPTSPSQTTSSGTDTAVEAAAAETDSTLAVTGVDTGQIALAGVALVALGGLVVVELSRRNRAL